GGDICQPERRRHVETRPSARNCLARARQGGGGGCRIRTQSREENHCRRRPQRKGANSDDDRRPVAQSRSLQRGCGRCASNCGHACPSSAERDTEGCIEMIGKLKGTVDSYGEDFVIVDVHGVGYTVHCSARTLQALPSVGEAVSLAIETHVREDQIRLFGFLADIDREWFRLLQTVQGVGTRVAISILSTLAPSDLASAIALRDKAMITRSPGVGPKVAERIVTELKDKVP